MKYKLASSSTEEGEITENSFPYFKSYLQYNYYPLTTKFIGNNTVPNSINYKNDGVISSKIKAEIKKDYPYISFNLLESHKPFFENKFKFIFEMTKDEKNEKLTLVSEEAALKEIKKFEKKQIGETRYDKYFKQFFFKKEFTEENLGNSNFTKIFCLEDRILENIEKENAFIFLRVSEETLNETRKIKKFAFEDIFFNSASFYEFLEIFQESLIKSNNSEEVRKFSINTSLITVFSSTTFKFGNETKRIFNTIDHPKNAMILFNKSGPEICKVESDLDNNINYLLSLDLSEGDYALNNKKIYKISNDGEKFQWTGICYKDFFKTIWNIYE